MLRTNRFHQPHLLALLAGLGLAACGAETNDPGETTDTTVQARRLSDGQLQQFSAQDEIPEGWIPCSDERCLIPPYVPCQNVGPTACVLQPECNLRTLACWHEGRFFEPQTGIETNAYDVDDAVEMSGVSSSAGAAADPAIAAPMPYPGDGQRCVVTCEHKNHRECSDYRDANSCASNPECQWEQLPVCLMPCTPEGCPPCAEPRGVCRERDPEPRPCVELDQRQCLDREDCEWSPIYYYDCADGQPCPGTSEPSASGSGEDGVARTADHDADSAVMPWRPHCQPRQPDPICPPIPMYYPICEGGLEPTPIHDDQGCIVGYECPVEPVCPPIDDGYPVCEGGVKPVPQYDDQGCLIGYACPVDPV